MAAKIAFVVCEHLLREAQAALAAEMLEDAVVAAYPARCGQPPLANEELAAIIAGLGDVQRVEIFGGGCLQNLAEKSANIRIHKLEQCFTLVADQALLGRILASGAYLATPGWLANWPANVERLGLDRETARMMFQETASGIVLLDTGVDGQSAEHLQAFTDYVGRSGSIVYVGITVLRLLFVRSVLAWRMEVRSQECAAVTRNIQQQSATNAMALDLLAKLARMVDEKEAVAAMLDVYVMLFAPQKLYYMSYQDGRPDKLWAWPVQPVEAEIESIKIRLADSAKEIGLTVAGQGFFLRIVRRGETRGLVAVENVAFPEYRDLYLNLALSIMDICDLPLENARKYQKLIETEELLEEANENLFHLSTTDVLTGIANRRAFDDFLAIEWKKMLRNGTSLSLIMIDIDFFKRYNDRYGHKEGDTCLHNVAQIIRKQLLRPGDFVARYGGEEFTVILPETDIADAYQIAEKIRLAVRKYNIIHEDSVVDRCVTLSLGVAQTKTPLIEEQTSATLFLAADAALYQAKAQGRNRTVRLSPDVEVVSGH